MLRQVVEDMDKKYLLHFFMMRSYRSNCVFNSLNYIIAILLCDDTNGHNV